MNNPTDEQVKGFWEWCGFTIKEHYLPESTPTDRITVTGLTAPDGEYLGSYPSIDLNNLFKYAVPSVWEGCIDSSKLYEIMDAWLREYVFGNDDPALALFWAIWEVIKGTNQS